MSTRQQPAVLDVKYLRIQQCGLEVFRSALMAPKSNVLEGRRNSSLTPVLTSSLAASGPGSSISTAQQTASNTEWRYLGWVSPLYNKKQLRPIGTPDSESCAFARWRVAPQIEGAARSAGYTPHEGAADHCHTARDPRQER